MKLLLLTEKPWKGLPIFFFIDQNVHTFLLFGLFDFFSNDFSECLTVVING